MSGQVLTLASLSWPQSPVISPTQTVLRTVPCSRVGWFPLSQATLLVPQDSHFWGSLWSASWVPASPSNLYQLSCYQTVRPLTNNQDDLGGLTCSELSQCSPDTEGPLLGAILLQLSVRVV